MAQASGLDLSAGERERVIEPLEALEQMFRPLTGNLTGDLDPAFCFHAGEDA